MNNLVFTSKQIIEEGMPILYIVHDDEDDWQFLSTFEKDESDGRVVSTNEIVQIDNSLSDLSWLPQGMEARRESKDSEWIVSVY